MPLHHATDAIRRPAPHPLLALHAGASAVFAAALLPPAGWPLALAGSMLILAMLARALRAPAAQPGRTASGSALLALDLVVFLLCYALRESDADWHATAFFTLLAA